MRKIQNIQNRALRRRQLKRAGKKLLATALCTAMLSMGIYPAGFPVNVSAGEAVSQAVGAVTYKETVDISTLTPEDGVITYYVNEDGSYCFKGSNYINDAYVPASIVVAPGVKADIYLDGLEIENDDGVAYTCGSGPFITGTSPIYISEFAQVSLHVVRQSALTVGENTSGITVCKDADLTLCDGERLAIKTQEWSAGVDVAGTFVMDGGSLSVSTGLSSIGIGSRDTLNRMDYSDSSIIINDGILDIETVNLPAIGCGKAYDYYFHNGNEINFGTIEIHGGQINASTTGYYSTSATYGDTVIGACYSEDNDSEGVRFDCGDIFIDGGNLELKQGRNNVYNNSSEKINYAIGHDKNDTSNIVIAGGNVYCYSDKAQITDGLDSKVGVRNSIGGEAVSHTAVSLSGESVDVVSGSSVINITSYDEAGNAYTYGSNDVKTDASGKLYVYLPSDRTKVSVALADRSLWEGTVSGGAVELALTENKSNAPVFSDGSFSFGYQADSGMNAPEVGASTDISYSYAVRKTCDSAPQNESEWTAMSSLSEVGTLRRGSYWMKAVAGNAQDSGVTYKGATSIISVNVGACTTPEYSEWNIYDKNKHVECATCLVCGETAFRTHDFSDKSGICINCKYECEHPSYRYSDITEECHDRVCKTCGQETSNISHSWAEPHATVEKEAFCFDYNEAEGKWISNSQGVCDSTAKTTWTFNMEEAGDFSFEWGVSTFGSGDYLYVIAEEGTENEKIVLDAQYGCSESGGYITGEAVCTGMAVGSHTLSAYYRKNFSYSDDGLDTAYIQFPEGFSYSDVVNGACFFYNSDSGKWIQNGWTDSCELRLTVNCEKDCTLPFRYESPQHGGFSIYVNNDYLYGTGQYDNHVEETVWIDLKQGINSIEARWKIYGNADEASCDSVYVEYVPDNAHYCEECKTILPHEYSSDCDETCNICGQARTTTGAHEYTSDCDTICNACGQVRTAAATHEYSSDCDAICNVCGEERETQAEHTFGADGKADICSCGILNIAKATVDADSLKLIYNGEEQCPEIVLKNTFGTVISADNYDVNIVSESAVSTGEGYTFTITGKGGTYAGTLTGTWTISYLVTDAVAVPEGEKKAEGEWFSSDVKIKAPQGYLIADSNRTDAVWNNYLGQNNSSTGSDTASAVVTNDGTTDVTYYLKDIRTGAITDAKTITVKKDSSVTAFEVVTATGEAAGLAAADDSVRVTFFASDSFSGMDTIKYSLDGADEVTVASGDSILVIEPGAHVLTAVAVDKAGNTASKEVRFTISEKEDDDNPGGETPGSETPGSETPGSETPGSETPGSETPGSETPGSETPGSETPGSETPGSETPGSETPGSETPGSETPGSETPGSETPGDEDPSSKFKAGDADCNGRVDLADAQTVLKIALRISVEVTEQGRRNADYDRNDKVDLTDAQYTLKTALRIKFDLQ